jgi:DUF1009 family protein
MRDALNVVKLGLIAGSGPLPLFALQEAERLGLAVTVAAIEEEASPEITVFVEKSTHPVSIHWIGLGQLGKLLRVFKREGVDKVTMVGQVKHVRVFAPGSRRPLDKLKHIPDLTMIRLLASLGQKDTGSLVRSVIARIEKENIQVLDSSVLLRRLLSEKGVLTDRAPTSDEVGDFDYGRVVALEIARLDLGQTIVVKDRAVVAVEAMEGTDATIRRAADLVAGERLTVVKASRPGKEMRFDLPVIGLKTLETMQECNVSALGVDAGRTLMIEKDRFLVKANQLGMTVVGF